MKFHSDIPTRNRLTLVGLFGLFFVPNVIMSILFPYDYTTTYTNYDHFALNSVVTLASLVPLIVMLVYGGFLLGIRYRIQWEARQ